MATELVCTAKINHRSNCETLCNDCSFLLPERRGRRKGWLHWSFRERRISSNWLPDAFELDEKALAPEEGRSTASSFLWTLVILLVAFNIMDAILTARALSLGFMEVNPLMANLFEISVPLGMAAKSAVVAAGAYALWRFRHVVLATRGIAVLTACYGAVVVYHLAFQLHG